MKSAADHLAVPALSGLVRIVVAIGLFAGASAAANITSKRLLIAIYTHTPAPVIVAPGGQLKAAEQAATLISGAVALCGFGPSMEPLYRTKTAVVIAPIKYNLLEKGMTVVFRSRLGHLVAHSLTGDLPKGWIAQGINNKTEDIDLVTKDNLVGVIVAAYVEGELSRAPTPDPPLLDLKRVHLSSGKR